MLMVDNTRGGVGIAPAGKGRVVSYARDDGFGIAGAILDAVAVMGFGDLLLLEVQLGVNGQLWPVEIDNSVYEAIRLATALGIVVVEAAGNGGNDLDQFRDFNTGRLIFNRNSPDFRDSGAIFVGAGTSTLPRTKSSFTNYGSRIDAHAWGDSITTTATDLADNPTLYTDGFNGTSGASPIVTGAGMIIQGIVNANLGFKLSPLQVRRLIGQAGTPTTNPAADKIALMPNLRGIIDGQYLRLAADIYFRDVVGDVGNPTNITTASSPDIIVRQQQVTGSPQAAFGAGSGTENNANLSQPVLANRTNFIYLRALNRGGQSAGGATAKVYWANASPMQNPNSWVEIGQASFPNLPTNRILTVASQPIAWQASNIPAPGGTGYSFLAIIGANDDQATLIPSSFNSFDQWINFVQKNNNVAWRSFNVVSQPTLMNGRKSGASEPQVLKFSIPGAFDQARSFAIKTIGSLPRGSTVNLKAPLTLTRALGVVLREDQLKGDKVEVPLHPFGRTDVGEGILPTGSEAACELHVTVPEGSYEKYGQYEFAVVQEWEGKEVGRLTYSFGAEE
jgi:serine protease